MIRMTTTKVNKALKAAGFGVEIVKGKGYFWFMTTSSAEIPSLFSMNLNGYTTDEIVDHVRAAFAVNAKRFAAGSDAFKMKLGRSA